MSLFSLLCVKYLSLNEEKAVLLSLHEVLFNPSLVSDGFLAFFYSDVLKYVVEMLSHRVMV